MTKTAQEVVINTEHGGFSLSDEAFILLCEWGHKDALKEAKEYVSLNKAYPDFYKNSHLRYVKRTDPLLIKAVKKLGVKASGESAKLKIVRIPVGVKWVIEEYDGLEWVAEKHRRWR